MHLSVHNPVVFLDPCITLQDFTMSTSVDTAIRLDGSHLVRSDPVTHLSFRLYSGHRRLMDEMAHRLRDCGSPISLLGPGYVCKHCGAVNQSGTLQCTWCRGSTRRDDWMVPQTLDMHLATIAWDPWSFLNPEDRVQSIEIDVLVETSPDLFYRSLITGNVLLLPTGCTLESGYYLCQKCGGSVRVGDLCPGCGGVQMPLSEIIKMDRQCVYCGRETRGDIVCRGCNARVSGLTYKKWKSQQTRETSKSPPYP